MHRSRGDLVLSRRDYDRGFDPMRIVDVFFLGSLVRNYIRIATKKRRILF